MSRILRRPMFRGGRVNSYGTGIASGLANGGRVGLENGGQLSESDFPFLINRPGENMGRKKPGLDYYDKRLISSVILNRLEKKMKLQIDATVVYAITEGRYNFNRN